MAKAVTKERLDEWKQDGPMRKWRLENHYGLHDAAGVIGIGVSSIQALEAGAQAPTPEMVKRIAKPLGYSVSGLRSAWGAWLKRRP